MRVPEIQDYLCRLGLEGWLLADFQGANPVARRVAGLENAMITRRWFGWVPRSGEPAWIYHAIESRAFEHLEGDHLPYASWTELSTRLRTLLADHSSVAMEYSPRGEIPWVSRVDGGTLELVRQTGTRVVSSADLIQWYEARWSAESLEWHLRAAEGLSQIKDLAFETVRSRVTQGQSLNEYGVQQEMVRQLAERRLVSDCPPIVAVNRRTADPHYLPTARESQPIHKGDLLLLDMWAKCDAPGAVYADITWVAFLGKRPPDRYQAVFQTVRTARDRGVEFVREASQKGTPPCGFEVDDAVRRVIEDAGYGPYFLHRTGHSLGVDVHGAGVNLDHLETCDTRRLIPGVAFSVEPGIYLEDFGIRSEINVFMAESGPRVTTLPVQDKLVCLA